MLHDWLLYILLVLAILTIPVAYRMGQISGEEQALRKQTLENAAKVRQHLRQKRLTRTR